MKIKPIVKWAGGKRLLADRIIEMMPDKIGTYYEPFLGGGAVLLKLQPENAIVNDSCKELINLYKIIRDQYKNFESVMNLHEDSEEYFYKLRERDRKPDYDFYSDIAKAARTLYLNKTCFNGLYRVNQKGQFNVPYGKYKNPKIFDKENAKALSEYLNKDGIQILNEDFGTAVSAAGSGDFIYFDPPYHPISLTSNFTGYGAGGFNAADQIKLKILCDELTDRGVKWIQSNSSASLIRDLYSKEYFLHPIKAARAINADAAGRGKIKEYLICNYKVDLNAASNK